MTELSPHMQCAEIRRTERNLGGFVKILKIIEASHVFYLYQPAPKVRYYNDPNKLLEISVADWTQHEDVTCEGCVGALLAWFFDSGYHVCVAGDSLVRGFEYGMNALDQYLGLGQERFSRNINDVLKEIMMDMDSVYGAYGSYPDRFEPFGQNQWPVSYVLVFEELQKRYPDK